MNYDKHGNIKPIDPEDITYQSPTRSLSGQILYTQTELDAEGLVNVINDLIKEINLLNKKKVSKK